MSKYLPNRFGVVVDKEKTLEEIAELHRRILKDLAMISYQFREEINDYGIIRVKSVD